jgi:hypothetical protein
MQLTVTSGAGRELLHAQQAANMVQHRSHVNIEMRVHSTRHRPRSIYDCQRRPFLIHLVRDGTAAKSGTVGRPVRAGRSATSNGDTTTSTHPAGRPPQTTE